MGPVLHGSAITTVEAIARNVVADVTGAVAPNAGHWLLEESPRAIVEAVTRFLAGRG